MTPSADDTTLARTARRAQARPQYLGWVFARYGKLQHVSEENLADTLGVTPRDWLRLGLCLRPRDTHFADDVRQISTRFKADPVVLAQVVRLVESASAMSAEEKQTPTAEEGMLLAARAREKRPPRSGKKK